MPRKFNRFIVDKAPEDLRLLIEKLALHVGEVGGIETFDKIDKNVLNNILSFYKKIDLLEQEEINVLWQSVDMMIKKLLGKKSMDVVDTDKDEKQAEEKKLLEGKYWIFPKGTKYIKCDDHAKFASENGNIFTENLGIDTFDYLHALHSKKDGVLRIVFAAGAIMANFVFEDNKKVGRFQLAQCSLPWLKEKLVKMPILKSHIRILDPHKDYAGETQGIYFVFRRPYK
jgi:hypothetical protein